MKRVAYVGPKPQISHKGIDFDKHQDDKYNYLPALAELIQALDHDYFEDQTYTFDAHPQNRNPEELLKILEKYCPDLDQLMRQEEDNVEQYLEDEINDINKNNNLNEEEKKAYINNLKIMKDYLIQFAINQNIYDCALKKLAQIVTKDHIQYIIVPMFQKYAYVLNNLQFILKDQKHPIDTKLEIIEEDGKMIAKLQVINLTT